VSEGTRSTSHRQFRSGPDSDLVQACLAGSGEAWSELIDRYKNLIYVIPLRYGLDSDAAADIFQSVCLDLYSELAKIRKVESLGSWLTSVARNKCYHWRQQQRRNGHLDPEDAEAAADGQLQSLTIQELEREQYVRDSIKQLPERCRRLIHLLFYETPPKPYSEVARELGLATGSIGFIRGRCLTKLYKILKSMDL